MRRGLRFVGHVQKKVTSSYHLSMKLHAGSTFSSVIFMTLSAGPTGNRKNDAQQTEPPVVGKF